MWRPVLAGLLGLGLAAPGWGSADLAVAISDSPDPVAAGQPLFYAITITNAGPGEAIGVQLTDILPAAVSFVGATVATTGIFADGFESGDTSAWGAAAPGPSCSVAGLIVTCSLGDVAAGGSLTVNLQVLVAAGASGQLSNLAVVGAQSSDPVPGNDSATSVTTVVAPSADLSLTIGDAPDPVAIGSNLTYTLTVFNHGPAAAVDTELQDALPLEVNYLFSNPPCNDGGDGFIVCSLGEVAAGAAVAVTITVAVTPDAFVAITNPASVVAATTDGNPGNNTDTEVTSVSGGGLRRGGQLEEVPLAGPLGLGILALALVAAAWRRLN